MFLTERLAHRRLNDWNQRIHTEDDALKFCRRHRIRIVEDPDEEYGQIVWYEGFAFILINPFLAIGMRTWVLFHEIGHYLLHAPASGRFSKLIESKADYEANAVAAVAMMPKAAITGKTFAEVAAEFEYPIELIQIRDHLVRNEGF